MVRAFGVLVALLALAACQQVPLQSSAALIQSAAAGASTQAAGGPYGVAIVKDLETGDAALGALFGASFRETLQREGYVRLALPGESGADAVTIQTATMRVSRSGLEIAVAVRDARGRLLDWYAVEYSGGALSGGRMFADAGEQVAKAIARAR